MRPITPSRLALPLLVLLIAALVAACGLTATTEPATTTVETSPAASPETPAAPVETPAAEPLAATDAPAEEATIAESPAAESPTPEQTEPADTPTPPATVTPAPTASPTSRPLIFPTRSIVGTGSLSEGVPTPPTPIPSPVPTFEVPKGMTNILLLGEDKGAAGAVDGRTDTMIIVSVDQEGRTASMISLPRDLYVYLPTRTMSRLNTAVALGGVPLLEQTILYNFGIPINYYAQVDFEGFKTIVDQLGGVEVAVSCRLQDWRLKSPELDQTKEENWEQFALEPGVYTMDGDLALWYARSRLTTTDFDRGRRQQQLLRAMFGQSIDLGLMTKAPELWNTFSNVVNTDMDIGRILQLASIGPGVANNGIQSLYLAGKMQSWSVPESGAQVQLPIWEGPGMMQETFQRLLLPPALNKAEVQPITVEIINASGWPDAAALAADNLAWYGLVPVIGETPENPELATMAFYNGPNLKGSYNWLLSWIMGKREDDTVLIDEPDYEYDYRVILGQDYDPCRPAFSAPQGVFGGS